MWEVIILGVNELWFMLQLKYITLPMGEGWNTYKTIQRQVSVDSFISLPYESIAINRKMGALSLESLRPRFDTQGEAKVGLQFFM